MVMEQKPAVVVMLTKVEENGKVSSLCTPKLSCMVCMPQLTSMHSVDVLCSFCKKYNYCIYAGRMCMRTHHTVQIAPCANTYVTAAQV